MNKEILKNVLSTSSVEFTYDEINKMLNDELEKSPEEMDTELVEICIDALSNYIDSGNKTADKKLMPVKTKACKKSIVKKMFLVAAIISIVLMLAITVSANIFNIDLPEEMVKIFGDRIVLNLSEDSKENNTLDENGLLSAFYSEKCVIESRSFVESRSETIIQFSVKNSEMYGTIDILPYSVTDKGLKDKNVFMNVEQVKQMVIGETEIVIASSADGFAFVSYNTEDNSVLIDFFNATVDDVVEFLENKTGE